MPLVSSRRRFLFSETKVCCKVLCFFIVLKGHENLTCVWHIAKTKDLYRSRRTSLFYTASLIIHHGTYFTAACACCNKISYMKGTLLYQDGGNRAFTLIQLSLDDKTSCCTVRVGLQLGNLCSQTGSSQEGHRYPHRSLQIPVRTMVVPPQSSGISSYSESSCFTRSMFALGLSILLMATMISTPAAFAWLIASTV